AKARKRMHQQPEQKAAGHGQGDGGAEIAQRVGDVGPEPGFGSHYMDEREQHLGRRDHGEAIDDPGAAEQFDHNDGAANERKLKGANARHETPSAFFDSSRSGAQSRPVSAPKAGSATSVESRSRDQPVVTMSMRRPGRADITATRSDSSAASSSACVISITVAPVSRQSRSSSSPISKRD